MKTCYQAFLLCVLLAWASGCASTHTQSKFTADTVQQIKSGMTKSQVTDLVGQPRSRSTDSDGMEAWQYRKDGQQGKGLKTYVNIASMGLASGQDAEFQDILTVIFKSDVVLKVTYQENVRSANPFEKN